MGKCQDELSDQIGVAELIPDETVKRILGVLDENGAEVSQWQNLSLGRRTAIDGVYARFQVPTANVGTTLQQVIAAKPAALRNFTFNLRQVGITEPSAFDVDLAAGTGLLL